MSWKDYFYFSKSQRIGLMVIILAIVIVSSCNLLLKQLFPAKSSEQNAGFKKEVASFLSSLEEDKPQYKYKPYYSKWRYNKLAYTPKEQQPIILFNFNPNTLDSIGFTRLGLKAYQVKNILKFRRKDGVFRSASDFKKMYGLKPEQYALLEPYITIPQTGRPTEAEQHISIDINSADSTQLLAIKGITLSQAKRILSYRNKLGGFVNAEQLKEVWGIDASSVTRLEKSLQINRDKIKQIAINKASVDKLRAHPYINFYQAKAIYEYRKNNGNIKSFNDLQKIEEDCCNEQFWQKIEPYLEFNSRY